MKQLVHTWWWNAKLPQNIIRLCSRRVRTWYNCPFRIITLQFAQIHTPWFKSERNKNFSIRILHVAVTVITIKCLQALLVYIRGVKYTCPLAPDELKSCQVNTTDKTLILPTHKNFDNWWNNVKPQTLYCPWVYQLGIVQSGFCLLILSISCWSLTKLFTYSHIHKNLTQEI